MISKLSQDWFLLVFLALVVIFSGADLIADLSEGVETSHVIQEAIIMTLAAVGLIWFLLKLNESKRAIRELRAELDSIHSQSQPEHIVQVKKQLSEVICEQFTQWKLTKSEQEVAMFLLKGFSLKEISDLRGTAEKTIRLQASNVYKKSGVAGRHAFSAWFIEDYL